MKNTLKNTLGTILFIPLITLLGLTLGCSKSNFTPNQPEAFISEQFSNRIVGGKPVLPNTNISQSTVALYFSLDGLQPDSTNKILSFCTGTLIDPSIVMTAAHCFVDFTNSVNSSFGTNLTTQQIAARVQVGFGLNITTSAISQTVPLRKVASYVIHGQYVADSVQNATTEAMYDIALIKLDSLSPTNAKPVALLEDASLIKKGQPVTLVGFGLLKAFPVQRTDKMMQVDVTIANPNINPTQWTYTVVGGKSSCSGDSGGPAYIIFSDGSIAIAGITSWGDSMCTQLGAYTSVPYFAPWIKANITKLKATTTILRKTTKKKTTRR
jgi:hypothetical protein